MTAVYAIICLPIRKIYIGQTKNTSRRWSWHKWALRKNKHSCPRLQAAWNKYGESMFRFFIIEESTQAKVYDRELWWIKKLQPFNPSVGFNRHWKEVRKFYGTNSDGSIRYGGKQKK